MNDTLAIKPGAYQAIPGSGKSFLAKKFPKEVVDSDDLLKQVTGGLKTKSAYDSMMKSTRLRERLATLILTSISQGYAVLCNFDPDDLNVPTVRRYYYAPDSYVAHLRLATRTDLLDTFSPQVLRSWARDYIKKKNSIVLPLGTFLFSAASNGR
jgi:hypothetical protein